MKKLFLTSIFIITLATGINMTSTLSASSDDSTINTPDNRMFVVAYTNNLKQPFSRKIKFEEVVAAEPKNEYVDYDISLLVEHFKSKGWLTEDIVTKTDEPYGDITLSFNITKNGSTIRFNVYAFKSGADLAAKYFIDALSQTSMGNPPYVQIPKEHSFGTITVYHIPNKTTHWYYRNVYANTYPLMEDGNTESNATQAIIDIQKILEAHTKKSINNGKRVKQAYVDLATVGLMF